MTLIPGIEFNGKHVVLQILGGKLFVKEYNPNGGWTGSCPTDEHGLPLFSQKTNPSIWLSPNQLHVTALAADDIHTLEYFYNGVWRGGLLP